MAVGAEEAEDMAGEAVADEAVVEAAAVVMVAVVPKTKMTNET
jgi:hypothetical protein